MPRSFQEIIGATSAALAVVLVGMNQGPAKANVVVEGATETPWPTRVQTTPSPTPERSPSNVNVREGVVTPWPIESVIVPWPVPANTVPWASNVYYLQGTSAYGKTSLQYIDSYLYNQCRRSGGRQYYCAGRPLKSQQIDMINRVGQLQMQRTHYRCGSNSWCTY